MEGSADLLHAKVTIFFASEVFDVFADPAGTKIASDKILKTAEVDAAYAAILTALEKTLPAKAK
jgi:hypothetical protein